MCIKEAKTHAQVNGLVVSAQQLVTDDEWLKQHVCRLSLMTGKLLVSADALMY